jgi:hypothetical protein
MISFEKRIDALTQLGSWLTGYGAWKAISSGPDNDQWTGFDSIVRKQHLYNQWLIEPFVVTAINCWAEKLTTESLRSFAGRYPELDSQHTPIDVAVIPQQHIPLAGLHDAVCIWLSGHRFFAKNIHHELDLLKSISEQLIAIEPGFEEMIHWVEVFPKSTDAYLVYSKSEENAAILQYFSARKSLIRSKRISVAILLPDFTSDEINALSGDIMDFFGHSFHNVRKIFVPANFSVEQFYPSIEHYEWTRQINRYANNFDYHHSVFLMDRITFFENGFLILRESAEMQVPIGCIHYEYYSSPEDLTQKLCSYKSEIQDIICKRDIVPGTILPGKAHHFPLWNFDDHQDVIKFLHG